ncbi:sensor histidine kinase [Nonomuraea wenchangensis]|uniref:sensor histidine kinase n=1 Tax=Nonomuraea wenchangensis TaxID=568860 RepID=UPI00371567A0
MEKAARSAGGLLVLLAVALADVVIYIASVSLYGKGHSALLTGLEIAHGVLWAGTAALILLRRPQDGMARFTALTLVTFGLGTVFSHADELASQGSPWAVPARAVDVLGGVLFGAFLLLFPDRKFVPSWTKWAFLVGSVDLVLNRTLPAFHGWLDASIFVASLATVLYAQIYRYRHIASARERHQIKWVSFGLVVMLALMILTIVAALIIYGEDVPADPPFVLKSMAHVALALVPLSIGAAVLRYRIWDIDPIIARTLVYGLLTLLVVSIYVTIVGLAGVALLGTVDIRLSLVVTGVIAVCFEPVRRKVQQAVNRMLYGNRDEPHVAVRRLGQRLETKLDLDTVLPVLTETVRDSLKLPYAAVVLGDPEDPVRLVERGESGGVELVRLALIHGNERVGELRVAPRSWQDTFSHSDQAVLQLLAQQAGAAAHAVLLAARLQRLTLDLKRSRTLLVTAREEERRQIRRNLHDGFGPNLSTLTHRLDAARHLIVVDPPAADALLLELKEHTRQMTDDIRRLVRGLRPPILDELGLTRALAEQIARLSHAGGPVIHLSAFTESSRLPAAVEVAAYLITLEALTNVVRHAKAECCEVTLSVRGAVLEIQVTDDGTGLTAGRPHGVGLATMRERAAELGGTCQISSSAAGTQVLATIPIEAP